MYSRPQSMSGYVSLPEHQSHCHGALSVQAAPPEVRSSSMFSRQQSMSGYGSLSDSMDSLNSSSIVVVTDSDPMLPDVCLEMNLETDIVLQGGWGPGWGPEWATTSCGGDLCSTERCRSFLLPF